MIKLKDGKELEHVIDGRCYESDFSIFHRSRLTYNGNTICKFTFSNYTISNPKDDSDLENHSGIEIHVDTNSRLVSKYKLPYYKQNVSDYYKSYRKYVTHKKCMKMKALDLGVVNLNIICKEIKAYSENLNGGNYAWIRIKGRATGANPESRKTRYIKIRK